MFKLKQLIQKNILYLRQCCLTHGQ